MPTFPTELAQSDSATTLIVPSGVQNTQPEQAVGAVDP